MKQITLGMVWNIDGHHMEVTKMYKNGKVQITETWISEDTLKDCRSVENYGVGTDENGQQYAYSIDYPEYRLYANGSDYSRFDKEENTMTTNKSEFTLNGVTYTQTEKGYCYKTTGTLDKKGQEMTMRIGKHVFEQAFDEFVKNGHDQGSAWEKEADDEYKIRKEEQGRKQEESDKEAEDAVNGKKEEPKAKKRTRKSKDIAFIFTPMGDESRQLTLTSKQVDFIKHIPDTCFYEHGLDSAPWCDVLADEIGGQFANKPMTVGAMLSTLKEKGLIATESEKVNGHKSKFFVFTDLGKVIASELGLE